MTVLAGLSKSPTKSVKLVAEYLAEPLTIIVNGCISNPYFRKLRKIARVSSISEVDNPITNDQFRPISTTTVIQSGVWKTCWLADVGFRRWRLSSSRQHFHFQQRMFDHNCPPRYKRRYKARHEEEKGDCQFLLIFLKLSTQYALTGP